MLKANLVRRVRVAREYLIVGTASSTSQSYWDKDFCEIARVPVGKAEEVVVEPLREMTDAELAFFGNAAGES